MSPDRHARTMLPIPDRPSPGLTTYDAKDPDTAFPPIEPLLPPEGSPNVLIILLDDVGFGAASTFGGPCRTPTADRLAAGGLRYNRFHTTALCAPTRAALLSGRNHHSVGMGSITETATSAPGNSSLRPNTKAPLAMTLKLNGYSTAQFGKCHEVPVWQSSPMGPFDAWPSAGGGFETFYGFIGGENNQWDPALYDGTTPVEPPATPEEGYHLTGDSQLFFPGMGRLSENSVVSVKNKSFSVTAEWIFPTAALDGVIIAQGGRFGGWCVYTKNGKAKFVYNVLGIQEFTTEADVPDPGRHPPDTHGIRLRRRRASQGRRRHPVLQRHSGRHRKGRSHPPMIFSADETTDIGYESGTTVTPDYTTRDSRFTGKINWVNRPRQRRSRPLHRPRGTPPHRHGQAVAETTGADQRLRGRHRLLLTR